MRNAGILALSLGLVCGGLAHAQQPMPSNNSGSKADEPRSLIEAVGWRKRCCQPSGDCATAAVPQAATSGAPATSAAAPCVPGAGTMGAMPGAAGPMYGVPGHGYGAPVPGAENGEKKSILGKGFHWSGHYPSWAWRQSPAPPPPPPEMYPGISWHRYPRSPRDFFMIEP